MSSFCVLIVCFHSFLYLRCCWIIIAKDTCLVFDAYLPFNLFCIDCWLRLIYCSSWWYMLCSGSYHFSYILYLLHSILWLSCWLTRLQIPKCTKGFPTKNLQGPVTKQCTLVAACEVYSCVSLGRSPAHIAVVLCKENLLPTWTTQITFHVALLFCITCVRYVLV